MSEYSEYIELFESYRNGDLSEAELKDFEARLVYDTDFRTSFEDYKIVEARLKTHFRNNLKARLREIDNSMDNTSKRKGGKLRILVWSSAAAAIIFGIFIFQHFSTPNHSKIAQQYWPEEAGLPVKMSGGGKYDEAMNAFKLEQWTVSKKLLLKIDTDTSNYFLGIIAYQQQDYQQAISRFKKVDNESVYYRESKFRLGLVLLTIEDILFAKKIFQEQIDRQTEFSDSSKDILEKIR